MDKNKTRVTILGAGISGLATAHWLNKAGYDVKILEANSEPGGAMITSKEEGFLIDYGPNSGLETTPLVSQLAEEPSVTLVCGRYGGIDQRFLNNNEIEEVSIGDYVLSGGELAALVLIDACVRKRPGVLGHAASADEDSFEDGLLEAPYYTRPQEWQSQQVPEILLSGDHKKIVHYKNQLSVLVTLQKRPDLLDSWTGDLEASLAFLLNLSESDLRVLGLDKNLVQERLKERING